MFYEKFKMYGVETLNIEENGRSWNKILRVEKPSIFLTLYT